MEDLFTVNDGNDSLDRRFVVDYTVYFLIFRRYGGPVHGQ